MNQLEQQIVDWLASDTQRMTILHSVQQLNLKDWAIGAGFVRNLVWDRLHNKKLNTPLNDIDVLYFDSEDLTPETDRLLEIKLREKLDLPWSVKNQARMHQRNDDEPYTSTIDAMSYWVEKETAVAVTMDDNEKLSILSAFELSLLFADSITFNPKGRKLKEFKARIASKNWLKNWPKLRITGSAGN